jgi:uncharacterized cupin superfamily protein
MTTSERPPAPRVLVRAGERGPDYATGHPYNPRCEVHGWPLSRLAGLGRIAVNLVRIPPGKESAVLHAHHREEEWAFVVAGRGAVRVGDVEHDVGAGDFLGFPPGVSHLVRDGAGEDLHVLVGGEVILDVEVADFPALGRRLVRTGARLAVYPLDAEVPFLPAEAQQAVAAMFGFAPRAAAPRVLVRAAERGDAKPIRHEENPRSLVHSTPLSRRAGLRRVAVNLARVPAGQESFVFHLHHAQEEWAFVLSGRGVAEVGDAEHEVGPGDFLGFPAGGPAHHLRAGAAEDLVYLSGGDAFGGVEVVDFPRLGRRKVWLDTRRTATYPLVPG